MNVCCKKQIIQFLKTKWYITHLFCYCHSVTWWNVNSRLVYALYLIYWQPPGQTEWMESGVTEFILWKIIFKFLWTSFLLQEIAFGTLKFKSLVNTLLLCLPSTHYLFEMKVEFFSPAGNEWFSMKFLVTSYCSVVTSRTRIG